jgi:hypothetical protein
MQTYLTMWDVHVMVRRKFAVTDQAAALRSGFLNLFCIIKFVMVNCTCWFYRQVIKKSVIKLI